MKRSLVVSLLVLLAFGSIHQSISRAELDVRLTYVSELILVAGATAVVWSLRVRRRTRWVLIFVAFASITLFAWWASSSVIAVFVPLDWRNLPPFILRVSIEFLLFFAFLWMSELWRRRARAS